MSGYSVHRIQINRIKNLFKNKNHFLDSWWFSALLALVSTLGISQRERLVSRICFYAIVSLVMWGANRFVPDFASLEAERWEARGVARPYIAVPISELEMIVIRESR